MRSHNNKRYVCSVTSVYVCKLHSTKFKITAQLKFSVFCSTESFKKKKTNKAKRIRTRKIAKKIIKL